MAPYGHVPCDGKRELTAVYCIGENPVSSEADSQHATKLLENLDTLIVQDIFMTQTAQIADVVFPAATVSKSEGTVTNSERRVQRVRKALDPPGDAKDDIWIIARLAERLGYDWGDLTARKPGTSSDRSRRCIVA